MEVHQELPSYYWLGDNQKILPELDKNYDMMMRASGVICPNCGYSTLGNESVPRDIVFDSRPTGLEIPNPFAHVYKVDFLSIVKPYLAHHVEGAVYWMKSGKQVLAPEYRSIYSPSQYATYIYRNDPNLVAIYCELCDALIEFRDQSQKKGYFIHSEVGDRLAVQFGVRRAICVQRILLDQLTENGLLFPDVVEYAQYNLPRPPFSRKSTQFMTYVTYLRRVAEQDK
jgi:hypothetical protein